MSLFLTENERKGFHEYRKREALGQEVFWALLNRVEARAQEPGLHGCGTESRWWYCVGEFVTDAAMVQAIKPGEGVGSWLRDVTLSLVRRSADNWAGPAFRTHGGQEPLGHLETAHLTWSVAVALDLAPDVFTAAERDEIAGVLGARALPMCQRWLEKNNHLANWRCVLNAGAAVAAAVLNDAESLARAADDYRLCLNVFQPDGSYGESLQYSNYAAYTLMLAREALVRRQPEWAGQLPLAPYALLPRWQAASLFYRKPLSGWGAAPRPRSANFNDSAAIFRPSGDLLLHIAARAREEYPTEAGLARWLFDALYAPDLVQAPHDGATFGFVNDFGFLTVPLLPAAAAALSPAAAKLPEVLPFSNGDVLARDAWDGRTVLAVHGGGDPLCGPGHLHFDLNSFILVHNRERLLVDPGHSCYRNLIHALEGSTRTHNTCTFEIEGGDALGLQEDQHRRRLLEQTRTARRRFDPATRTPEPPVDRGARRLLAARLGPVTVIGSEAAALYGAPLEEFSRFWILCGAQALFIVDHIVSAEPVRTVWNWLLNNRDGGLELKLVPPDRLVARRGTVGLKLFHLGGGNLQGPHHAFVHDAYSPEPDQVGEGHSGSGKLIGWREAQPALERTVVHAVALDTYGLVAGWHLRDAAGAPVLESPDKKTRWRLHCDAAARRITIQEEGAGQTWTVSATAGSWGLKREE
ncbi:MAG: heparinase II/III-family protein [Candidatus Marinimicrobia bacterium]|nr:heparinase II/III-family protein [Candidatus Neomarinimicrobiota bacterium]